MSAVLDVPLHLIMALSLAAAAPGEGASRDAAQVQARVQVLAASARHEPRRPEGPFRFGEHSWLCALHSGAAAGTSAGQLATRIFRTSSGRCYVPVPAERAQILALRSDALVAANVAVALGRHNAAAMAPRLGRQPLPGELYAAHLRGSTAAIRFIELAERRPAIPSASVASEIGELAAVAPTLGAAYRKVVTAMPPELPAQVAAASHAADGQKPRAVPGDGAVIDGAMLAILAAPARMAWHATAAEGGHSAAFVVVDAASADGRD